LFRIEMVMNVNYFSRIITGYTYSTKQLLA